MLFSNKYKSNNSASLEQRIGMPFGALMVMIGALLSAVSATYAIPFNIGAIISSMGASYGDAGLVTTIELAGTSVASLLGASLIGRVPVKTLCILGMIMVLVGNVLSLAATELNFLMFGRAVTGIGGGLVVASIFALAARSAKPEMTFGIIGAFGGVGLAVGSIVAPMAIFWGDYHGVLYVYTGLAIFGLLLSMTRFPKFAPKSKGESITQAQYNGFIGWGVLIGIGIIFLAFGGIQGFIERMGVGLGISSHAIGFSLLVGGLLSIVGPAAAGSIGPRFGSAKPIIIIFSLLVLFIFILATTTNAVTFLTTLPIFLVLPLIGGPLVLGALSVIDPSGKLTAIYPSFCTMGLALGPAVVGCIVDNAGFSLLGTFAAVTISFGAVFLFLGARLADSIR